MGQRHARKSLPGHVWVGLEGVCWCVPPQAITIFLVKKLTRKVTGGYEAVTYEYSSLLCALSKLLGWIRSNVGKAP